MKLSKRNVVLIIALCFTFSLAFSLLFTKAIEQSTSAVNIPKLINYQGRLTENGNPITGSITVTFSIYDIPTGGTPLWTETQNVNVTDGVFNTLLGGTNPLTPSVFSSEETYLGIQIEDDGEIQPRQRLASVAYAFFAQDANTVGGQTSSEILASHTQDVPHMIFVTSASVSAPSEPLEFTISVPSEAKIAIINIVFSDNVGSGAGQLMLTKEGCRSAMIQHTWNINQVKTVTASWSENTIKISRSSGMDNIEVIAYFYR